MPRVFFANKIKNKRNYYQGSNYSYSLLEMNLHEKSDQFRRDKFDEDADRFGFLWNLIVPVKVQGSFVWVKDDCFFKECAWKIVNENNLLVEFPIMRRMPIWDKEFPGSYSLPPNPSRRWNHMWSDFWAEANKVWCVQTIMQLSICVRYKCKGIINISWGLAKPLQLRL